MQDQTGRRLETSEDQGRSFLGKFVGMNKLTVAMHMLEIKKQSNQ
jgi:hypothetical protein